ncbi:pectinesterase family protein [Hymenobacter baengnokdamensis]|uniref:pectinesterase family protein n=1 Tax=Hymenobacter baengnokdamensis TaxID=2615203 RepID=UPI00124888C7|nr:pectinesterase family protein [Hymenobacter baengnokdamensis]
MRLLILLWLFAASSATALAQSRQVVVSADGTGNYRTIQAALDAVPKGNHTPFTIFVRRGTYHEKLTLNKKQDFVKLLGEGSDPAAVVLTFDDFKGRLVNGDTLSTSNSATLRVYATDFAAENLTIQNTAGASSQAVAAWVYGDRAQFKNCRFLGFRDTLYPYGYGSRQLYKNCYIEGSTDAILGSATALFEDCTVFCKPGGICLMAPSTPDTVRYGFVLQRCHITGDAAASAYFLARPWKPFAKTVLLNCVLDAVVNPRGWDHWGKESNKQDTFFAEFKSTGPGATPKLRAPWGRQLTPEQASFYTRERVLRGWQPEQAVN